MVAEKQEVLNKVSLLFMPSDLTHSVLPIFEYCLPLIF